MTKLAMISLVAATIVLPLAPADAHGRQTPFEDVVLRRFHQAVNEYVSLHRDLERSLPRLQVTSDPQQICQAVDARAAAIRAARPAARVGDIFDPEVGELLRVRIQNVLAEHGVLVSDVLADVNEEAPVDAPWPVVNGRFPWARGARMPVDILGVLPPLPSELHTGSSIVT